MSQGALGILPFGDVASDAQNADRFPVTITDSRTATNMAAGGRTQLSGLISAGALTVLLLYLNDVLRVLPETALWHAAIGV